MCEEKRKEDEHTRKRWRERERERGGGEREREREREGEREKERDRERGKDLEGAERERACKVVVDVTPVHRQGPIGRSGWGMRWSMIKTVKKTSM